MPKSLRHPFLALKAASLHYKKPFFHLTKPLYLTQKDEFIRTSLLSPKLRPPKTGQEIYMENIARYMEAHPHVRLRLDGYADNNTGSERVNLYLSMRRATNLRDMLINDYGISGSRIEAQGMGINAQPYEENDWNRVVIVTVIE